MQKALPWVLGGCMLGMIAIMIFSGVRQLSPYMLMMPLMMVMAAVGLMAGGGSGGKKVPEINADRKEYLRYLAGLRTRVTSSAAAQVTFFNYHAPHPDDLLSIIGTHRQWSRAANADFYAATRIGLGSEPAVDRLLKPAVGGELAGPAGAPQPHLEPVSHMWVTKFLRTHGLIHDCPKLVQLRTFPTIAVGGDPEGAAGLLTAMICHLAVFHPPDLLQIRVLTDNPEDPDWAWLKWLPHVQHQSDTDAAGATRLVFTRPDGLSDLTARGPHTADATPNGPYVVVIDLDRRQSRIPGRRPIRRHRHHARQPSWVGLPDPRRRRRHRRRPVAEPDVPAGGQPRGRDDARAGRAHRPQARRLVDHRDDHRQEHPGAEEGRHRVARDRRRADRRGGDPGALADVHRHRP